MKYIALLINKVDELAVSGLSFGEAIEFLNEKVNSNTIEALILEDDPLEARYVDEFGFICTNKLVASIRVIK